MKNIIWLLLISMYIIEWFDFGLGINFFSILKFWLFTIQKSFISSLLYIPPEINSESYELQYELNLLIFFNLKYFVIFSGYTSKDKEPVSGINIYKPKLSNFGCNILLYKRISSSPILLNSSNSIEKVAFIIFLDMAYSWIKFINKSSLFISLSFNKYFCFNLIESDAIFELKKSSNNPNLENEPNSVLYIILDLV